MSVRIPILVLTLPVAASGTALAQAVAEVEIQPSSAQMRVGSRTSLVGQAKDANGAVIATAQFRWTSSDLGVVRVEVNPAITSIATLIAMGAGIATVEARVGNRRGTAAVQVTAAGPGGDDRPPRGTGTATILQLEPQALWLLPQEETRLTPRFLKEDGTPAAPQPLTWQALGQAVSVDDRGGLVALQEGEVLVQASAQSGLRSRAQVRVRGDQYVSVRSAVSLSPGSEDSIRIFVPEQNERFVSPLLFQWTTSNPRVARVSQRGVVSAVSAGKAEIIATLGFQAHRVPVTVHRQVEFMDVEPESGTVQVPLRGSIPFEVVLEDADTTPVLEAIPTWEVADTSVASFDPATGMATGKKLGSTTLIVKGPGAGLEAKWELNVIAGGLRLLRDRIGLGIGERFTASASFTDESGVAIAPATGVSWTSADPSVALAGESGTIEGVAFGHASVTASTPWGSSDAMDVYVQGEILIASNRGGNFDVYAFDRGATDRLNQITTDLTTEFNASYSPDGARIAYVSIQGGDQDIYVMNADGTVPVRLTTAPAREDVPDWTPDGRKIVYQSDQTGARQVWIMNSDGSDPHPLTEAGSNSQPAVSPTGSTVAFTSTRDGNRDIYLMDLDGSNQRNLTNSQVNETLPTWFSDGRLAFIVEQQTGAEITASVMLADLQTGQMQAISPTGLPITDFAISRDADLLALVVTSVDQAGAQVQKIFLLELGGGPAGPVEVTRQAPDEQMVTPSFRK